MKGFTLVELMVSVAIFAMMTALVVVKYGSFNQSVLLTNLAYDVALTIRTAQTYGLSVKAPTDSSPTFTSAYGVTIGTDSTACGNLGGVSDSHQFMLYADVSPNGFCDESDVPISIYAVKRGAVISGVCTDTAACTMGTGILDITFKRPEPRATICLRGVSCTASYAEIELRAPDGSTRRVSIRSNGQISVVN
jgi:prepilin-type N-terminal cleavage/methylation domain-containing protein